ncbi:endonuclease/exonuclease/phosphatase family protein [Maricaulis sp. CAU 1757]
MAHTPIRHLAPLACLCALGLAGAVWAAPLSPWLDLTRQVWPASVLLGLVAVLATLPARRLAWTLPTLVAAGLIAMPGISDWLRGSQPVADAATAFDSPVLRVGSANLRGLSVGANADLAAAVLPTNAPDLLALQEVSGDALDSLERLRPDYASLVQCRTVALLSADALLDGGCVTHPPGIDFSNAIPCDWELPPAVWGRFRRADGSIYVAVSAHLTWPIGNDGAQACQYRNLGRALDVFERDRVIVMGDMNAAAPSHALARIETHLDLVRHSFGHASFPDIAGMTGLPVPGAMIGIDHIFAGPDWHALEVHTGSSIGSDHRPLLGRFALHPPG